MPEAIFPSTPFVKEASQPQYLKTKNDAQQREIATRHNQELVGFGAESVVIPSPTDPSKVIAIEHQWKPTSPTQAKMLFHNHRIFNILFPHNFPRLYASIGKNVGYPEAVAGTLRQRIIPGEKRNKNYSFSKVERFVEDQGLGVAFDIGTKNMMIGEDGGDYYVDLIQGTTEWNEDAIIAYMQAHGYKQGDIKIVKKSIGKLRRLHEKQNIVTKQDTLSVENDKDLPETL